MAEPEKHLRHRKCIHNAGNTFHGSVVPHYYADNSLVSDSLYKMQIFAVIFIVMKVSKRNIDGLFPDVAIVKL